MLLRETLSSVTAIVLASGSPRRRELLTQLLPEGATFEVRKSTFAEDLPKGDDAAAYCVATATAKGNEVSDLVGDPSALVISADTVVVSAAGEVLEKPRDADHAVEMLRGLSGGSHSVVTACALFHGGRRRAFSESTAVTFSELSDEAIRAYVATGDPLDKAGAYGIQNQAGAFVEKIDGCYYNVVGLPMNRLARELQLFLPQRGDGGYFGCTI